MNLMTALVRSAVLLALGVAAVASLQLSARGEDWPRWRGPNLDGISKETGWLAQWPAEGPKKLWEAGVGIGYSSLAVSKGRVYTMGNIAEKDGVSCFEAETGKLRWRHDYACASRDPNGYHGTRCTPTVDEDRVYTVSRHGNFFCLDAATGNPIWSKDLKKDLAGREPRNGQREGWGYAGSPLIEKNWVLIEVGGEGASVAAFDKMTGEVVWKAGSDCPGYASLIAFDLGGERCFAQFSEANIIVRRMKNGSELWRLPWKTSYGVNAATPIIQGDEMFISSGYGFGCALLKMSPESVKEVWRNKSMKNHVNSCVLVDGHIYGYDDSELKCLDWKTGEVKKTGDANWGTKAYGKGAILVAGDKFILFGQTGKLGVAEINPNEFKELSSFQALPGKDTWANPVLANGRLYVRNLDKVAAFDVKAK
ncbi:MAG: PQQ-like beta-propeller repeat protein [Verrucomicrobia bacterium]|nr:PQQ-like beta-propeller repeat protein [Verrucomicrobiota bacterium]